MSVSFRFDTPLKHKEGVCTLVNLFTERGCVKTNIRYPFALSFRAKRRLYLDEMTGDVLNEVNLLSLGAGEEMLHYVQHDRIIGLSAF